MSELAKAVADQEAAASRVRELREQASQVAAELATEQATHVAARAAQDEALGLQALGRKPKKLAELDAAVEASTRKLRGLTSAGMLLVSEIEAATVAQQAATVRVTAVAATDAAMRIAAPLKRANELMAQAAEQLALAYSLEALSRGSAEMLSGENAAVIGGAAHEALLSHGLSFGRGLNGSASISPAPGARTKLTPRALLEMSAPAK